MDQDLPPGLENTFAAGAGRIPTVGAALATGRPIAQAIQPVAPLPSPVPAAAGVTAPPTLAEKATSISERARNGINNLLGIADPVTEPVTLPANAPNPTLDTGAASFAGTRGDSRPIFYNMKTQQLLSQ